MYSTHNIYIGANAGVFIGVNSGGNSMNKKYKQQDVWHCAKCNKSFSTAAPGLRCGVCDSKLEILRQVVEAK